MTICHHLDDATLMRYAAGDLDEAFSVVVASHIAVCADCRNNARMAEGLGGALLEDEAGEAVCPDSFDRLMERIEAAPAIEVAKKRTVSGDVPLPLQRYIGASLDTIKWRTVAPGVRKHTISTSDHGSQLYMLAIGPGMAMPEHGHGGGEITMILSGAYRDAFGRFGPGDVADLDEHVEHQPRVEPYAPCICLVATETPTRFKSRIARLLQPLIGI